MNTTANQQGHRRKRKAAVPPYTRLQHTLPLGETPEVRSILRSEGLWELRCAELREVYYYRIDQRNRRRDYCAVGWPNENGGFEIRQPRYTGCVGRKGMTFIEGEPGNLFIFQDFTDYLCWRYYHKDLHPNILILNHPEFLDAAKKRALRFNAVTVFDGGEQTRLIRPSGHGTQPINASA